MGSLLNLANFLSFSRILLSIPMWFSLKSINANSNIESIYWFLFLCLIIAISDLFDGYVARYYNTVTDIGKFLDPFADKICVLVFIIYLSIEFGFYYLSLFVVLAIRDIIIAIVSIYFVKTRNLYFQANNYGKWFLFFIAISMILSVVLIPDIINVENKYLITINNVFYIFSWICFLFATYKYFKTYYLAYSKD